MCVVKYSREKSVEVMATARRVWEEMRLAFVELADAETCPDHGCKLYGTRDGQGNCDFVVIHSEVYGCQKPVHNPAELTF